LASTGKLYIIYMLKIAKNANFGGMIVCIVSGLTYLADYLITSTDKLIGLIGVQFLAMAYMMYGNVKVMEKLISDVKELDSGE